MKPRSRSTRPSVRELCELALLAALMLGLQMAMAALPNIHLTALLVILGAVFFGWKCLYSVAVFVVLEGLIWGFGIWWVSYLYVWPLLAAAASLMRACRSPLIWAVTAGMHGLLFGAMCALPYLFVGGAEAAFAYWIAGLGFDLAHCAANFALTLLLFRPLYALLEKLLPAPQS